MLHAMLSNVVGIAPSRPHLLFVLADDFGYNDIGYHQNAVSPANPIGLPTTNAAAGVLPTPKLDKLASEGVKLASYYVQPLCSPTRSALMTGRYPQHTGIGPDVDRIDWPHGVPARETFLPELLRDRAGYDCHMVGKWVRRRPTEPSICSRAHRASDRARAAPGRVRRAVPADVPRLRVVPWVRGGRAGVLRVRVRPRGHDGGRTAAVPRREQIQHLLEHALRRRGGARAVRARRRRLAQAALHVRRVPSPAESRARSLPTARHRASTDSPPLALQSRCTTRMTCRRSRSST